MMGIIYRHKNEKEMNIAGNSACRGNGKCIQKTLMNKVTV
jgi:hypothetical protein